MAKYDDASWHHEGDFPADLPYKASATHIGMFLAWCIDNGLLSEEQEKDNAEDINSVKNRNLTGAEFLLKNSDGKLIDEDLNDIGNAFAGDYYESENSFAETVSNYNSDYDKIFAAEAKRKGISYPTSYHVEDTWGSYNVLKPALDQRFAEWEAFKNQKKN